MHNCISLASQRVEQSRDEPTHLHMVLQAITKRLAPIFFFRRYKKKNNCEKGLKKKRKEATIACQITGRPVRVERTAIKSTPGLFFSFFFLSLFSFKKKKMRLSAQRFP